MKIYILNVFIFLVIGIHPIKSNAQQIEKIGLKAGWSYATITSSIHIPGKLHWIKNSSVGAFTSFEISRTLGFQVELLYLSTGWAHGINGNRIEFQLNYIQMPILAKISSIENKYVCIDFLGGPTLGKKLSQTLPVGAGAELDTSLFDNHHFDAGFTFGGDLCFRRVIIKGDVIFSPRYYWGLTKINRGQNYKNRAIMLMLGYALSIK